MGQGQLFGCRHVPAILRGLHLEASPQAPLDGMLRSICMHEACSMGI